MNVTILGNKAIYVSDYTPTNKVWKKQLNDAFRFVRIAGVDCFVKRFDARPAPWDFLVSSRREQHLGLPLIHDAQSATEEGKTVYYLFLEKIEGEILHDIIRKGGKASGPGLGRAMADAFRFLHSKGYWHADFCTKNIMVATGGQRFVLIDLDSLAPTTTAPSPTPNHPGYIPDQELAIYALTYVKNYVQPATNTLASLHGSKLNLLQLIFLLDKLVYFAVSLKPQGTKFGQKAHYSNLPALVHQHLGPYTDKVVKDILFNHPVSDEVLLSQGRNFQAKLQAAPKPTPVKAHTSVALPRAVENTTIVKRQSAPTPPITPRVILNRPKAAALVPPSATIDYLRVSNSLISQGESTVVTWATTGATVVSLTFSPAVINLYPKVAATGSLTLTYEMLAFYSGKEQGQVNLTLSVDHSKQTKLCSVELKSIIYNLADLAPDPVALSFPPITPAKKSKFSFWMLIVGILGAWLVAFVASNF
jgi:hypothetical protein